LLGEGTRLVKFPFLVQPEVLLRCQQRLSFGSTLHINVKIVRSLFLTKHHVMATQGIVEERH